MHLNFNFNFFSKHFLKEIRKSCMNKGPIAKTDGPNSNVKTDGRSPNTICLGTKTPKLLNLNVNIYIYIYIVRSLGL